MLLTAYSQLDLFRTVNGLIAERYEKYTELSDNIRERINRHMQDINKKFAHILQQMIRE